MKYFSSVVVVSIDGERVDRFDFTKLADALEFLYECAPDDERRRLVERPVKATSAQDAIDRANYAANSKTNGER